MSTANIRVWTAFEIQTNAGKLKSGGSITKPLVFQATSGKIDDIEFTIAVSTTTTIWDATTSIAGSFEFLFIETDKDIMLELMTDQNNGVGKQQYTVKLKAGGSFILCSDDSYANYTAAFGGGTLDVIDKITARNLSASDIATVRRVVAV